MVDASLVLDAIVAVSIAMGAIFAVLELRGMARDRRTHLVLDIFAYVGTLEYSEQWAKIMNAEFKTAEEAEEKCSFVTMSMIARYYEGVGLLIRRGLVDADLVFESLPIDLLWNKMKPWCLDKRSTKPDSYVHFEYAAEKCAAYLAENYGKQAATSTMR